MTHTKKVKEHAHYARKKSIMQDPSERPWDLNQILQSPYVGAVILKSSVDDDSFSISLYSQKIIDYVNNLEVPLQFFCDGSFSFINHLQLLIIGVRLATSVSEKDGQPLSEFFPFGILITN